ncbi:thermostable hemolysin [Paracoccus sp. TK19116]|uniref:Thermostable hemolysin n=1 Tax=Paracoccus albicereus TaxID=2922394 RepID=A0ABT1MUL0_9RHOB|nr:thermostable hemolysin [Paracoccus albicereus]MCQ0972007.1 thermostable hemolysin [Paracoccus albicereus]
MQAEILDWRAPDWHAAAALIETHFSATYQANFTLPALPLAVARGAGGRILGAAGLRDAGRGFLSEVYLDRPLTETLGDLTGSPVEASDVIEIVSMACPVPTAILPLIEVITAEGRRRGASWGLFTATAPLLRMLRRTGVPVMALAPARPTRLPDAPPVGQLLQHRPLGLCGAGKHRAPALHAPSGHPLDRGPSQMIPVFDALARHAHERPDAIAFIDRQERLTWAELADAVGRAAAGFAIGPRTVGLRLSGLDYVIGDLAATLAGCRVVPVPGFFSTGQVAHLLQDAGATLVDELPQGDRALPLTYSGGAERVIYTSGTTGRPKGVVLGDRQLTASAHGLSRVLGAGPQDRYLSALPQAQLLEQICGIFLPIMAGAETVICPPEAAALFTGDGRALARIADQTRPTVTVLAPRQLTLWVAALRAGAARPDSLRYVAVGGAPVSPALIAEARSLGLPVAEGYGLSEACSVVALTPQDSADGSAMVPMDGTVLRIEDGEIVVDGPTVMAGYLHHEPHAGPWRTGDLGRIEGGRVTVLGRRDAMILRASGRNIAPEWVEAEALADPAVPAAALILMPDDALVLVLAATAAPDMAALVGRLSGLPAYARPDALVIADPRHPGLIRPSGNADRQIARQIAVQPQTLIPLTLGVAA